MTAQEAQKIIQKYFPREQWNNAVRVAQGESSLRSNAVNYNNDGSIDYGLFQINSVHLPAILQQFGYTAQDLLDPEKNAQVAKWIYDRNQGWHPWVAAQNLGLDRVPYTPSDINAQPQYNEKLTYQDNTGKTWKFNNQTQKYEQQGVTPVASTQYTPTLSKDITSPVPAKTKKPDVWETIKNLIVPQVYGQETSSQNYNPITTPSNQYTVRAGDTLWGIAQNTLGSGNRWRELQGYVGSPATMPVGTRITIPTSSQPAPNTSTRQGAIYTPLPKKTLPLNFSLAPTANSSASFKK